jgi:cytoskeleton protein RodZ
MEELAHDQQQSSTVGAELLAARETQQLTLADVAARTRIPLRHLSAIENADYARLPAATYSAGFVRTYARLLGLDATDLSQRFRAELAAHEPAGQARREEVYEPADPARVPSLGLALVGVLIAVLAVLGFLYWRGSQSENPAEVATAADRPAAVPATVAAAPAPPPAAAPAVTASAAPAPASTDTAVLTADEPVWLRVSDGDSKLFEGMLKAGDHFQVPASAADPRLRTGRAEVLKVMVGRATIPPLGPPETLIKDISLKPDALLGHVAAPAASTGSSPQPN